MNMKTFTVSFDVNGEHHEAKVVAANETDAGLKAGFYIASTFYMGLPLPTTFDFTDVNTAALGSEISNVVAKEV